jgi:hypothetical protein
MDNNLQRRTVILKKLINIAEHLKEMGNFNGVMEIIAGINMHPITRLKQTWEVWRFVY